MSKILTVEEIYKQNVQIGLKTFQKANDFNIFRIEEMKFQETKPLSKNRRNFFKVSLVTGYSKITYADCEFIIEASALVFTNPMIPYQWEILDEYQTGFICVFSEEFYKSLYNIRELPVYQNPHNAVIRLNSAQLDSYQALFVRMIDEVQSDYLYKYDLLRSILLSLIHEAQKMLPDMDIIYKTKNASEKIASSFLEILEMQFPIEFSTQNLLLRSPNQFAKKLGIHINHLNKAIKEITGKTTSQLIKERLLRESKVLLKSTEWSISAISWCLGFEEANHFSSFFKEREKISPLKYRQS